MSASSSRIAYISFLQILGAALVILYHSFHEYPGNPYALPALKLFQTVRMPLFTFISGFLFTLSMNRPEHYKSWRMFAWTKFQRLIVPFLVLETIAFLPRALMSDFGADEPVQLSLSSFIRGTLYTGSLTVEFLWFLPMIFVLLTSACILHHLSGRHRCVMYVMALMAGTALYLAFDGTEVPVLGLGRLTDLTVFFVLGMVYGQWRGHADRWLGKWWQGALCALIWLAAFHVDWPPRWLQMLMSVAGIAMMLCLALNISGRTRFWKHLDGMNYMMYLLSWFTCVASQQLLAHFTDFPWWVYTVLAFASSIYIPLFIGRTLQHLAPRSRVARSMLWLLGHNPGKYKRSASAPISRLSDGRQEYAAGRGTC